MTSSCKWPILTQFTKYSRLSVIIFLTILGKFVAIRGTVVRVSNVKPLVTNMAFSCNLCGEMQVQWM